MNQKVILKQMIPFMFILLLVGGVMIFALSAGSLPASQAASALSASQVSVAGMADFDYEHAAEILAMRWGAMGRFYEAQGLLTRDDFDYERAAEIMAYRWNAMAEVYQRLGLLNDRSYPDDVLVSPWYLLFSVSKKRKSK